MRIFTLEDDPVRILKLYDFFKSKGVKEADMDWAASMWQVDRFGDGHNIYDLILLDHDLGGRRMLEAEDNGLNFLEMIKEKVGDALVVIHSHNPSGAEAMHAAYPPSLVIPYNGPRFWILLESLFRTDTRTK